MLGEETALLCSGLLLRLLALQRHVLIVHDFLHIHFRDEDSGLALAWLGLVQSDKTMGQRILKMEYRRFLRRLVQIPCQILQRGRRLLYRLLNVNDWTETLLSGVPSPKRVRYG